jgi:hypothetical protein
MHSFKHFTQTNLSKQTYQTHPPNTFKPRLFSNKHGWKLASGDVKKEIIFKQIRLEAVT